MFVLPALSVAGLATSLILCEALARVMNGQSLVRLRLPPPRFDRARPPRVDPEVGGPLTPDIDPAWIAVEPPPPAPREVDRDLLAQALAVRGRGIPMFELFRVWNRVMIAERGCGADSPVVRLPQPLHVFEPTGPIPHPPYRYLPSRRRRSGWSTNRFGWRGPDIPLDKPPGTIRLAFVGASTTAGVPSIPFSYPEYVVHWLNLWAERNRLGVRFDGINAGREGLSPLDIAAVVRQEVAPTEPDLVLYYEGANTSVCSRYPQVPLPRPGPARRLAGRVVEAGRDSSALVRRLEAGLVRFDMNDGREPAKPEVEVDWPIGLDEAHPDIGSALLPAHLKGKVEAMDSARSALAKVGGELATASFVVLVRPGLTLDPNRHQAIFRHLNEHCWPYRYADIRRDIDLDNRVMEEYARRHGLAFIDVAGAFPSVPDLFFDAFHFNASGTRMHAWIVFRALMPVVRSRLASGAWPRPDREPLAEHPGIRPPEPFQLSCGAAAVSR